MMPSILGLDVYQATISVAVLDSAGQLVMEAILETKAERFPSLSMVCGSACTYPLRKGPGRPLLHDLLEPHVTQVLVCDPRKNNLGKVGNKNDRHDARELAELLYRNKLEPVYHGEQGLRTLKELARGYLALTRDSLAQ
jgi:hypothetical protein